jgi:hypothetical protein
MTLAVSSLLLHKLQASLHELIHLLGDGFVPGVEQATRHRLISMPTTKKLHIKNAFTSLIISDLDFFGQNHAFFWTL